MNAIRSLALNRSSNYLTSHTQSVYSDSHNVAFRKGNSSYMTLMVLNNLGMNASTYTVNMSNVGFPAGLMVVDVLSCRNVTVDSGGGLVAQFVAGLPMVSFYISLILLHKIPSLCLKVVPDQIQGVLSIFPASGNRLV